MIKNANSTVIGSFIVGAVILIVIVFLVFGSGKFFTNTNQFVVYFRSSPQGLSVGAPVKLKGIKIGTVTKITPIYDTKGIFTVEVIIEVEEGVVKIIGQIKHMTTKQQMENIIRKGFKAQLESESMVTGKLYIKLDLFPNEKLILGGYRKDLVEIPSIPNKFELLEQDVKKVFDRFGKIEFEKIAKNFNNLLVGIDSLARSPILYKNMEEMAENLMLTQQLISRIDSAVIPTVGGFTNVTNSISETLKYTKELMIRLENVAANNRYELHQVLIEIRKSSESMRNLTDYLQRDPSSPLFGK